MTTEIKYSKNDVVSMLNEDARLTEQALHGYLAANDVYLQVLFDQNPKSIGGAMPGADFYCIP